VLSVTRNPINGSIVITAEVTDPITPFSFYETKSFYGYTIAEAKKLYREHLTAKSMKLVK
jgi:hypothetical protein